MTLTIDLPEELASRLAASMPEEERVEFAIHAIADALEAHLQDEAECIAALEEAYEELEAGRGLMTLEEAWRQWEEGPIKERLDRLAKATEPIEEPSGLPESLGRKDLNESGSKTTFHVYENWVADGHKARIHRSECSFCKNGSGTHSNAGTKNGKWHGGFTTLEAALEAAEKTRGNVTQCKHCLPSV